MELSKPKFSFYEIVFVRAFDIKTQHIETQTGAILGMVQDDDGSWGYAVHLYKTATCAYFHEHELVATGRTDWRETFYDGSTIKVKVHLPSGEGYIVDDEVDSLT